jgi:hypothetical protein
MHPMHGVTSVNSSNSCCGYARLYAYTNTVSMNLQSSLIKFLYCAMVLEGVHTINHIRCQPASSVSEFLFLVAMSAQCPIAGYGMLPHTH